MRVPALCLFLLAPQLLRAQDAVEIVRKSVSRSTRDFERLRDYTFVERNQEKFFDKNGKVSKSESETFEITILGQRPYSKKIAHNDQPLSEKEALKEQQKLDKEAARRQRESAKEKANLEKERRESRKFLEEIPEAYNFRLLGTETISGKPAWAIEATPKPGYIPKHKDAKVLTKAKAKIWIDQAEYQWVKAEADVLEPMSFGWGLLRIGAGATLHFEQVRVNDEVWLPRNIAVRADARLGFVKTMRGEFLVDYRDYKKFQTESRLVDEPNPQAVK